MIYLDNGATSAIKPKTVVDAVCAAMTEGYGNPGRGSHPWAQNAYLALRKARKNVAKLLHVDTRIALTSGVTESLNVAIQGLIEEGDHVITSEAEHNSVLRPLYATSCELDFLPLDDNFAPDVTKLEDLLKTNTKAVVITHASNVVGSVTDLDRIFEFAVKHDLYLIVDGAQALGQFSVDLSDAPKDKLVYCFAGHKSLYGPTGTGGFYYGKNVDMPPLKSGGSGIESFNHTMPDEQPIKWEAGTANVHGFAGLAAGVDFVMADDYFETKNRVFDKLLKGLRELDDYEIYYPETHGTCCVGILKKGMSSQELSLILQDHDIATRPGYHCAPRLHEYLGTKETGLCRLSTSYFTTDEEIEETLRVLSSIE